ncbi:site-2 protease family protein [Alkalibacter saccharofermentans]|uniref:Zn-dependent protease (Includes SpoIVFB) n=1 Tax=Alkalibacter saccharofermentans DSM 14828 TaxID=1120975 RepID=A0A1M4UI71_9FIRM|nr:site-2 protease family protein [Alkalibacter saccharofermentans]SHE56407.1 Zn-dependent protease (includes SpoIVFB) [Alkalibacter saccharofermentans DSM 14828]
MNGILDRFDSFIYMLPALLISITFHELAHGFVAYKLGDPTAKQMGRLTLNPIKHIDPTGLMMLFFFRFGWAKPIPYNPNYFINRKQGTLLVALAGPVMNLIIALLSVIWIMLTNGMGIEFFAMLLQFNIIFAIFNMIPLPPLDGSKVIASLLPDKLESYFWKYERFGYPVILVLAVTGMISRIIIPAYNVVSYGLIYLVQIFL